MKFLDDFFEQPKTIKKHQNFRNLFRMKHIFKKIRKLTFSKNGFFYFLENNPFLKKV